MVRVDNESSYERVNGTAVGGGTFWGLCHLLTGVSDFDEMLELSKEGKAERVDLLVGDIYGSDYSKMGLSSSMTASSFGKILYKDRKLTREEIKYVCQASDLTFAMSVKIPGNILTLFFGFAQTGRSCHFAVANDCQQHWPDCLPYCSSAWNQAYLLGRIFLPQPRRNFIQALLRHQFLVQGQNEGMI
jgi:pantothenate kinase